MNLYSAALPQLSLMLQCVREELMKKEISQKEATLFEVAVEEALVNIIKHGYHEKEGEISLSFLQTGPREIALEIKDRAPFFNPLENQPLFDPSQSLDERQVGGGGLYLLGKLVDKLTYRREEPFNILLLQKYFKPEASEENLHSLESQ